MGFWRCCSFWSGAFFPGKRGICGSGRKGRPRRINQLLLSYQHAERNAARQDFLSSLFQKAPASAYEELLEEAGVSVKEISEEKNGNFNKIHVVGTGSFSQIVRGFDIIKSKEVWNVVKLVRLKREGTTLSFALEITAFQSRGTYEEEKYRTDRSDGDR